MNHKNNDYLTKYPTLLNEWNYEKNGDLKPESISAGSGKKVWWKCSSGHEWQATIYNRKGGRGCPYCSGKKILKRFNDLATLNPTLAQEWNYEKNGDLTPDKIALNCNTKVWWMCSKGHEWQAAINNRNAGSGCPYCANRKILKGFNDLSTINPDLAKEWNYEKNDDLTPEQIIAESPKKVWWKCSLGHEWQAAINKRNAGTGCPYCVNRKILKGFNDLSTINPNLAQEWNYEKNGDLTPDRIALNCNKKVWWKCVIGHEWVATPNSRNAGTGCPYCANQKVLVGYNDLNSTNLELIKEWNYEKNGNLTPEQVTAGSTKKVWWKCSLGHEWQTSIINRSKGRDCPYCANRKILKGFNDLATINPELAKEWNYEKNGDLTPDQIIAGSPQKVWWKCSEGHEWQATIASRNKNHFCPICDRNKHSSISEKAIVYYLQQSNIVLEENKKIDNYELDIYIPSLKLGIEYDGAYFHKDATKDTKKNILMKEKGIYLIRFREPGLPILDEENSLNYMIPHFTHDYSFLNEPIIWLLQKLNIENIDVNVDRDINNIYKLFQIGEKKESICQTHPKLIKEWNYEKNGDLSPEKVSKGTHLKVWWKCSKGHEWQAQVYSRCTGIGCPECAKKQYGKYSAKTVKQYDKQGNLINTFESVSEAEHVTGIKNIWYVCSGKRNSAGGFCWKFG